MNVDKAEIGDKVKKVFMDLFQIKESKWQDGYDKEDFFSTKIGLLPGDVLAYLYAVEKEFGLQVPASDIIEGKFNTLFNVTDIIYDALCAEGQ